ncbi:MAG: putative DNA-binding protein [Bacillota bacterium]|nr:putative DNA-binding protein [Bacillota bacterium]
MEERIKISILMDYYGILLTDKQLDIMNLYYNDDLSLSEISEINNTSRQAIHDIIKRCNKLLLDYEEKLKLMNNNIIFEQAKKNIIKKINTVLSNATNQSSLISLIDDIKKDIMDL